jgi:two-component system phosphate regulon sensor histidine kinase PhoR
MIEETMRILVVDDELGVREGCRRILCEEGFEVQTAQDGQAGLELFEREGPFAVLLVDLMMPRLSGLELVKRIKSEDPGLVIIIITAHATIDSAVEGTKLGAYSYLPKPFTPDELLLAIRNGLEWRALTLETRRLREERERRLLEVASERSRSNTIIKCMTDAVLVINFEKLIVLRNAAAAHILPDCATRPLPFPMGELHCEQVREMILEILQSGAVPQILSREISLGKLTYMVNVSPVLEPSGETSGAVAVFRDISALKKLETAKSMFVSMVAHELKNPLAAAEGWLNLLLGDVVKTSVEEQRRILQRSVLRIQTLRLLVSELLNLTAIETGNFSLRRAPVDIGAVLGEAVEAARDKAREKRIRLGFAGPRAAHANGQRALADREALLTIFANLIDNAIKYTPEEGQVEVSLAQDGMYARVTVEDTGIGMEAHDLERVFDEFYRAKNEYTANIPGTGLGLSLVKRLTDLHQGSVSAHSQPGKGSSFTVSIPLS